MKVKEFIEHIKQFEDWKIEYLDANLNYQSLTLDDLFEDYGESILKIAPELYADN